MACLNDTRKTQFDEQNKPTAGISICPSKVSGTCKNRFRDAPKDTVGAGERQGAGHTWDTTGLRRVRPWTDRLGLGSTLPDGSKRLLEGLFFVGETLASFRPTRAELREHLCEPFVLAFVQAKHDAVSFALVGFAPEASG